MDEHGPKANGVGGTPPTRGPFKPFPGPPAQPAADADAERQGVKADHGQPSHRRSSSWDALQRRSPLQPHVAGSPPRNSSPPVQVPSPLVRAPPTSGCHAAAQQVFCFIPSKAVPLVLEQSGIDPHRLTTATVGCPPAGALLQVLSWAPPTFILFAHQVSCCCTATVPC
jgi:hypothetical protein